MKTCSLSLALEAPPTSELVIRLPVYGAMAEDHDAKPFLSLSTGPSQSRRTARRGSGGMSRGLFACDVPHPCNHLRDRTGR